MSDKKPPPDDDGYKVGYCKPPRHSQYPKGISGCPGGQAKGPKTPRSAQEMAAKVLGRKVAVRGRKRRVPVTEVLIGAMAKKAADGDVSAFRVLWPLVAGTPAFGKRRQTMDEMAASLTPDEKAAINGIRRTLDEIIKSKGGSAPDGEEAGINLTEPGEGQKE